MEELGKSTIQVHREGLTLSPNVGIIRQAVHKGYRDIAKHVVTEGIRAAFCRAPPAQAGP